MNKLLDVELSVPTETSKLIVPISVHCHTACNLVVWKPVDSETDERDWGAIRIIMAKLMDRLVDLLHDYQLFSPLVALIELQETSESWSHLTGDQDWHRGRFIVQSVKTDIEEAKERWLGPLKSVDYSPRRVTSVEFTRLLKEAVHSAKPPKGADATLFSRYADNLMISVESDKSDEFGIAWRSELISDINSLLGEQVLEGVNDVGYF
ncbi:MAG: hypothetical protein AB2565_12910 [Candidatus Thiodiazotropha endolucinida]|uniref:Uncharacterized protein n=1 Tax=Candidatus Thiodiazotropha endolucinida TaxID=1655433 RepID=A0A7Z1AF33_9GAMM|nr:hypothetical protein [Candidatus Thiodiazotropha endolucinida]ODJ86724.1 hypothetical protein CODIS_30430 [Candidatus Thiodiazotropha endolucinida]